jgi:hypothetical protein
MHFVKFMHLIHKLHIYPFNVHHKMLIFVPASVHFPLNRYIYLNITSSIALHKIFSANSNPLLKSVINRLNVSPINLIDIKIFKEDN